MKLINEHLSEGFSRNNDDKLSVLNIGKISLINEWLNKYKVKNFYIRNDLTIIVDGHLYLDYDNMTILPDYIQFDTVTGFMECKLQSFKGVPFFIHRHFLTMNTDVNTTKYLPKKIKGDLLINSFKIPEEELIEYSKNVEGEMFIGIIGKNWQKWKNKT